MKLSKRFINFALIFCISLVAFTFGSCKGRTMENMEPSGDTIEVVIMQDPNVE